MYDEIASQSNLPRKEIKKGSIRWLFANSRDNSNIGIGNVKYPVDQYMRRNFPFVYGILVHWECVNNKKTLSVQCQELEGRLFLNTFAPFVEALLQCDVITLHDGLFVKKSDYERNTAKIPEIDAAWYRLLESGKLE